MKVQKKMRKSSKGEKIIWVIGNERTWMLGLPITPNIPIDFCNLIHEESFG